MVKGALFKQWINNGYNYGSTTKGALFKQWINNGYNYGKGSSV